jgi:hypothetical protein
MVKFIFAHGAEHDFDYDWNKLAPKMQLGGLRLFKADRDTLIPLNSNTIAMIKNIPEEIEEVVEPEVVVEEEIVEEEPEVEEKPLSIQEKKDKILAEMKEKSECKHDNHDYYYQEIVSGPSGDRKTQKRYFPVCSFCGVRERYVAAAKLSDDQKDNAKLWDK